MITGYDSLKSLESILSMKATTPSAILNNKNAILRWLVEVSGYVQSSAEDLQSAALASLTTLPPSTFLPACLLRILSHPDHKWLGENPWRLKTIQYLESAAIGTTFYAGSVTMGSQNHDKFDHLVRTVALVEQKFCAATEELTTLDRLSPSRQVVLSSLNNSQGRYLLRPFLPPTIDTSLKELYTRTDTYCHERDSDQVAEHFATASQEVEHFLKQLKTLDLAYARSLEKMSERLDSLLRDDFARNPSALPATISIDRNSKKYPLHITQRQHHLSFVVHNPGPGYAYNVALLIEGNEPLTLTKESIFVGRLAPHSCYRVDVEGSLATPVTTAAMNVLADWRNFDGTVHEEMFELTLLGQRVDVPWDHLVERQPYSLEPIDTEEDLVGRKELCQRLVATITAKNAGSTILHGQKRIGKTSIAKALKSRMEREGHVVVYLEAGDYIVPLAENTVACLGTTLCSRIGQADPRFANLPMPDFSDALSPLTGFLEQVCKLIPRNTRIVLILDEFDQLPLELYDRTSVGDAFFLTLRSLTSRPQVAFVLVGGERMVHILDRQGQQLNKWHSIAIDHFQKETDWLDYKELIQKPTEHTLDFSDDALAQIYDTSAGNPFFTNQLCQQIFQTALQNRDSHVTVHEVSEATRMVTANADRNMFQHFWDDGILEIGDRAVRRSTRRKKILLATADVLGRECPATSSSIKTEQLLKDLEDVDAELRELVARNILVGQDAFEFKVPLFFRWLRDRGVHDIIASFDVLDHYTLTRRHEAKQQIASDELLALTSSWSHYRGQHITDDRVRAWLAQFSGAQEQRLAFTILQKLKCYSNGLVREKLRELDAVVGRKITSRTISGRKRSDLLISYLDGVGKSGAHCASLYAEEAGVYVGNVVERGRIAEKLMARDDIRGLVFVDDFIGTGESVSGYMNSLNKPLVELVKKLKLPVVIVGVAACTEGQRRLEEVKESWPIEVDLFIGESLDESFRCFGDASAVFSESEERAAAKTMALRYGKTLEKKCPLGYGDLELAVVFERGCPNNSLPMLWSRSSRWTPLFPRD